MTRTINSALGTLALIILTGTAMAAEPAAQKALALRPVVGPFGTPRILVATSMPPQFELLFDREMPTPGWSIVVDALEIDPAGRRVVAKLSEIAPAGNAAQVVTPMTLRLPLGALERGRVLVELWQRRGTGGPHVLTQALVLQAE